MPHTIHLRLPAATISCPQVVSVFLETAFDPWVSAKVGSGITRLAFSTGGDSPVPLPLSDLATPIVFSLPATDYALKTGGKPSGAPLEAACVFYDEELMRYRREAQRAAPLSRSAARGASAHGAAWSRD